METPVEFFKIDPFWDDEFKHLDYETEPFNNSDDVHKWINLGYPNKFTGAMCDMRRAQPTWNQQIINEFTKREWKDVCTSYYKMSSGTILPLHQDTYKRYIELFDIEEPKNIYRAIIFLEDWSSGHYLEINGQPVVSWSAGDTVVWQYDTPHLAANMGDKPRYTLQITGHV